VHVLGAGAIGLLVAHHLRRALPHDCLTLLLRSEQAVQRYNSDHNGSITLYPPDGNQQQPVSVQVHAEAARGSQQIHNLVLATKSQDALQALRSIQHRLVPSATLLLLQNGLPAVYQVPCRDFLQHAASPRYPFLVLQLVELRNEHLAPCRSCGVRARCSMQAQVAAVQRQPMMQRH
jgi:2-dehydropantoate 2-reductase